MKNTEVFAKYETNSYAIVVKKVFRSEDTNDKNAGREGSHPDVMQLRLHLGTDGRAVLGTKKTQRHHRQDTTHMEADQVRLREPKGSVPASTQEPRNRQQGNWLWYKEQACTRPLLSESIQ